MKPDVKICSLEPSVPILPLPEGWWSLGACSTTSLGPGEGAALKGLDLGSMSSARSAPEPLQCCIIQGLQAGKLRQMDSYGQMARMVAQWSQKPPSLLSKCTVSESPPSLWEWRRPLLHISSKADVYTGRLALQGHSATSGTPSVGATAWKPLTLGLPGVCSTD